MNQTTGEIVTADFRAAAIFHKYRIDFCCKGNQPLNAVCELKNIEIGKVLDDLKGLIAQEGNDKPFNTWPIDQMVDYIVQVRHQRVREQVPAIAQFINKVAAVHGKVSEELYEIRDIFFTVGSSMASHMRKEEDILFPYILNLYQQHKAGAYHRLPNLEMIIAQMHREHAEEGERMERIALLSKGYTPPEYGCKTLLQEFEVQLHEHIHLENNILFPWAIETQTRVMEAVLN